MTNIPQELRGSLPRTAAALRDVFTRMRESADPAASELQAEVDSLARMFAAYSELCTRTRVLEGLVTGDRERGITRLVYFAGDPEPDPFISHVWDELDRPWMQLHGRWVLLRRRRRLFSGKVTYRLPPTPMPSLPWDELTSERRYLAARSIAGWVTPPR